MMVNDRSTAQATSIYKQDGHNGRRTSSKNIADLETCSSQEGKRSIPPQDSIENIADSSIVPGVENASRMVSTSLNMADNDVMASMGNIADHREATGREIVSSVIPDIESYTGKNSTSLNMGEDITDLKEVTGGQRYSRAKTIAHHVKSGDEEVQLPQGTARPIKATGLEQHHTIDHTAEEVVLNRTQAVSIKAPLTLGEMHTAAVIDTGAEVTVISDKYFNKIPVENRPKARPASRRLVVAEQGRKLSSQGIADVQFSISGVKYEWPMYVAPIGDDLLLGADFLDFHNARVDFCKGLKLGGDWVECEIQRGSGGIGRVVLEQDIVVPSGHEMIIPGRSQFDSASELLCMLEPGHQSTEVTVGRVLVYVQDSKNIPVRCVNLQDEASWVTYTKLTKWSLLTTKTSNVSQRSSVVVT